MTAVNVFGGIVIRTKCGTFKRNTGEEATRARVAKHFGAHVGISVCCCITSDWPRGYRSVAAQFYFAFEDGRRASFVHDQQDEISSLPADLESYAAAFQREHRWGAPRSAEMFAGAANHRAAGIAFADHECCLEYGRKYDDAFRLLQYFLRNVVGDVHDFLHYDPGIFQALLFLIWVCRTECCRGESYTCEHK